LRFTNVSPENFHFFCDFFFPDLVDAVDAVLQFSKGYSNTLKILLYLYINIELNFDFRITYFGTATLHQVHQREQNDVKKPEKFGSLIELYYLCTAKVIQV